MSICISFSTASSEFGENRSRYVFSEKYNRQLCATSPGKNTNYFVIFLRNIYTCTNFYACCTVKSSRMSASLGHTRYYTYSTPYAVPRLNKSTKHITHEVQYELSPGQWPTLTVTILMIISILIYYMHYISKSKISSTRSKSSGT